MISDCYFITPKEIANWLLNDVKRVISDSHSSFRSFAEKVSPKTLVTVILLYRSNVVTRTIARSILRELLNE